MNTDLKEMFNEKNQSLFFNKLIMDLENNTDTFKLASKNIVKIEIAKLFSSLKKIYDKYSIEANEDNLKKLLSDEKNLLLETVNLLIDEKCDKNKEFIENCDRSSTLSNKYVKTYHKNIDVVEEDFEGKLKVTILENSEIQLYNSLIKLHTCANEDMQQEIITKINLEFSKNLINRITNESKHRNMTLKNISEETYKSYLNLNKNSVKIEKNSKVKCKKNN